MTRAHQIRFQSPGRGRSRGKLAAGRAGMLCCAGGAPGLVAQAGTQFFATLNEMPVTECRIACRPPAWRQAVRVGPARSPSPTKPYGGGRRKDGGSKDARGNERAAMGQAGDVDSMK